MSYKNFLLSIDNKEDKLLFSKLYKQMLYAEKSFKTVFSDFLPIFKAKQFLDYINKDIKDIKTCFFGGYEQAERGIIAFYKANKQINKKDFLIGILEISYNPKYARLTHRDFLGALIGLGLDRAKFGDIILDENKAICFIKKDILEYVLLNLKKVAKTKVSLNIYSIDKYFVPNMHYKTKNIIVKSTRIDAILAAAFNISRAKALDFIKAQKVFLNWNLQLSPSKNICENDIITIRGVGRIKILNFVSKTKKDNIVLNILKYN